MKATMPSPITSVSAMHKYVNLKGPTHPLVSVINLADIEHNPAHIGQSLTYHFYSVAIKKNVEGKVRYGQQYYDFDEGMMTFVAPHQVISIDKHTPIKMDGLMLMIHPDFFQNYPLARRIKEYGFFSYSVHEALHLSPDEEETVAQLMQNIEREGRKSIDVFTQDLMVSSIDLLLNYCNRFYNRQFITRKVASHDIDSKLERLLDDYFESDQLAITGPPSVEFVAEALHLSPNYLSDMLRSHTGQNTQQHIQHKVLDKAKEALTTTALSVSEIAYQLGFAHPQSFTKLFKSKTNFSPLAYRQSFN